MVEANSECSSCESTQIFAQRYFQEKKDGEKVIPQNSE